MTGSACRECLEFAEALELAGPAIDARPARDRPRDVIALGPAGLREIAAGSGGPGTFDGVVGEPPDSGREQAGVISACRHGGDFPWPAELVDDPDPPSALYALGDPALLAPRRIRVAIVGARRATPYGSRTARSLARTVAEAGGVVVSGLALGIDAEAHLGALDAGGGTTIAVVAGGVDRPYPVTNRRIHERIAETGCIVSEMPPGCGVWRWSFPARNRLIAAISDVVVVVEAAARSGSMHTADAALERSRSLAAVPGPIDSPASAGTNRLAADGALVVESPESLLGMCGLEPRPRRMPADNLVPLLETVRAGGIDEVLATTEGGAATILADLARLELGGFVERAGDGSWRAAP